MASDSHSNRWTDTSLQSVHAEIWEALRRGQHDPGSALHWPALSTVDEQGYPEARTLVLRDVDAAHRTLTAYTDWRSAKVAEMRARPEAHWLFHDSDERLQIRARGATTLHHLDATCAAIWDDLDSDARLHYAAQPAPGVVTAEPTSGLPAEWIEQTPEVSELDELQTNFCVLITRVSSLEMLYLGKDRFQRRAMWRYDDMGKVGEASWIVP